MSLRRLSLLLALPTVVGISLSACGTEDDAAPGPSGGSGTTAGSGGTGATAGAGAIAGKGGGMDSEGGEGGNEPGTGGANGEGGDGGDGAGGAGGDGAGGAGGDSAGGAGGEGGQAPVACHADLFKFDTDPGTGAMKTYLTPATGPVQNSTVSWDSSEGATTPGAGKLIATFGALGEQAQLSVYPARGPIACRNKLHAMVKLVSATDLSAINGVSLSINSGPFDATGRYSSQFTSTSSWVVNPW